MLFKKYKNTFSFPKIYFKHLDKKSEIIYYQRDSIQLGKILFFPVVFFIMNIYLIFIRLKNDHGYIYEIKLLMNKLWNDWDTPVFTFKKIQNYPIFIKIIFILYSLTLFFIIGLFGFILIIFLEYALLSSLFIMTINNLIGFIIAITFLIISLIILIIHIYLSIFNKSKK